MGSLYEISNERILLMDELENMEGEITPEMEKALTINESDLKIKSKGYVEVIKDREAVILAGKTEIKRIQDIIKRNENVINTLKDNLLNAVLLFGNFEVGLVKFSTRKSESLNVLDAKLIPNKYKVQVITEKVEKVEIKKAIKAGDNIEGVELIENKNLSIK